MKCELNKFGKSFEFVVLDPYPLPMINQGAKNRHDMNRV